MQNKNKLNNQFILGGKIYFAKKGHRYLKWKEYWLPLIHITKLHIQELLVFGCCAPDFLRCIDHYFELTQNFCLYSLWALLIPQFQERMILPRHHTFLCLVSYSSTLHTSFLWKSNQPTWRCILIWKENSNSKLLYFYCLKYIIICVHPSLSHLNESSNLFSSLAD